MQPRPAYRKPTLKAEPDAVQAEEARAHLANAEPLPVRYQLKRQEIARVNPAPGATDASGPGAIDVKEILRGNLAHEVRSKNGVIDIYTPPKSRRWRDYLAVLIGGNALLVGLAAILPNSGVAMIFALAGVVIFSTGLTWTMFVVMDDYT